MDDWYKVTTKDFVSRGGSHLLTKYNHSPSSVVMGVFGKHDWMIHKFESVPRSFWKTKDNQLSFMKYLDDPRKLF
jgi:hypothetical protein